MFDIRSVQLTNFRSYRGEHLWVLPDTPGLYFLTGRNDENPRLGRNDCGKSTLLEAINWCLYGKTSRGLRASDVVTWGETTCKVTVVLNINGEVKEVTRVQQPNLLTVNGVVSDSVQLSTLHQQSFNYAVIIPQFGTHFFDLTPAAKLTLFSEIMELEGWLALSAKADTDARGLGEAIATSELRLNKLEGQSEALVIDISNLTGKAKTHKSQQALDITSIEDELKQTRLRLKEMAKLVKGLKAERAGISKDIKAEHKLITSFDADLKRSDTKDKALLKEIFSIEAKIDALKNSTNIVGLGPTCPTCLQSIDKNHAMLQHNRVTREVYELGKVLKLLTDDQAGVLKALDHVERSAALAQKTLVDLNREDIALDRQLAVLTSQVEGHEAKVEMAEEEIKRTKDEPNPYEAMLKDKLASYEQLEEQLRDLTGELEQYRADHAAVEFWVTGFKRLRLSVVEDTLRSLEIEVNSSLASLGLGDWRVQFDVEHENKSGTVTKGFTVAVHSPAGEVGPWAGWGGAVTQLLRLAGALGLANLIMIRAGLRSQVEFYDEPSHHLSPEALHSLLDTLHHRALAEGKKVWIVDHSAIDYGNFLGQLLVVKDHSGSHIDSA